MKRRTQIIFLVFWITVIFLLTGYPSIPVPPIKQFPADKIGHAAVFLVMGLIQRRLFGFRKYCLLGCAVVLAAEFQQLIIPGRTFEVGDILAGLIGIAAPLVLIRGRAEAARPGPEDNTRRSQNGLPET